MYFWTATTSADVVNPTASQLAFIQGVSAAPVLPFVRRRPAPSLTNKLSPSNNFGRYESRGEGLGPNPRALSKGLEITATEYELHGSTVLSQKGQIAMQMAMSGGLLQYIASMGRGYAWTEHDKIIDMVVNDAYSGTWQGFGVPFYSASQPKYGTAAVRSNRLATALDATALKTAMTMLDEMQGYDGEYNRQVGKWLGVSSAAGPDAIELCNSLTRMSVGTTSLDAGGFGLSGPSFIGQSNIMPFSTPAIDDDDNWALFGDQFTVDVLFVAQSRPKLEVLQGTEDAIISDNPIIQLLVADHCAAIGGGPA